MSKSLIPKDGQDISKEKRDKVYTPEYLAKAIVDHFKPSGRVLEPCKGSGSFYDQLALRNDIFKLDYAEIDEGLDFFNIKDINYNWIITNPPFSQFRAFLNKSMEVSSNVVFLCLINAIFQNAKLNDIEKAGFIIKEILYIPKDLCPTQKDGWTSLGMSLGAIHLSKKLNGEPLKDIKFSKLSINPVKTC